MGRFKKVGWAAAWVGTVVLVLSLLSAASAVWGS